MLRALLVVFLLPLAVSLAQAQTPDGPVMGSSATAEQAPADDGERVIRVLAIGDAVGGGLGAGLTRMGEADGRYEVTIRYNEESGLARPEVYDWATTLPKILSSGDYDVIVVLIGTNDRQTIRDGEQRYAFDAPEWIAAYTRQIDNLLAVFKTSSAKVFWVSIPPMKDADYDSAMRRITDLQKQRVEPNGITFVDIRPAFLKPDGGFADYGPDDTSEYVRLRARNGVGFYKAGNNRMGQLVLQAIEKAPVREPPAVEKPAEEPRPQPHTQSPMVQATAPKPSMPMFGQTLFGGGIALVDAGDLARRAATMVTNAVASPAKTVAKLKAMAKPGSAAEKFFGGVAAAPAPAGRADDFSVPAAPVQ